MKDVRESAETRQKVGDHAKGRFEMSENPQAGDNMTGIERIAAERKRQVKEEKIHTGA